MRENPFSWELFSKVPIVGIVRNLAFDDFKNILPQFYDAGLTTIEITMNTAQAGEMIKYAVDNYSTSMNIGAGTVCSENDLDKALDAGARFIVTPIINEKVILNCVDKKISIFPGAFTPSEIYRAWSMGASMIKIFPATTVG
ncbi:2-dehydro-3-deoxyphosphogluconate aldolase / (4S)-4-hydroxy-2-oxoglutarate aldolase, partial [Pricia antarctica]